MNQLVEEVSQYAEKIFKTHPSFFRYHNLLHTKEVVNIVKDLAENTGIDDSESELLLIAAWFHDIGYPDAVWNHEKRGAEMAEEFLEKKDYPPHKIADIKKLILSTKVPHHPENRLEKIMCDADIAYIGKKDFLSRINQLREEWKKTIKKEFSDTEWIMENIRFLESNSFYTEYAKKKYEDTCRENLAALKLLLAENKERYNG